MKTFLIGVGFMIFGYMDHNQSQWPFILGVALMVLGFVMFINRIIDPSTKGTGFTEFGFDSFGDFFGGDGGCGGGDSGGCGGGE